MLLPNASSSVLDVIPKYSAQRPYNLFLEVLLTMLRIEITSRQCSGRGSFPTERELPELIPTKRN